MWRIRLHGRGGHGIKTASQILGSAAFYSGFQAQDFPLYGAERRGAPIVAFTRLSRETILERGSITRPDLLLIGDETLLKDFQAAPLCGADSSTGIFINSPHGPETLKRQFNLPSLPVSANLSELGIQYLNKGTLLSASLASAGARLLGNIEWPDLSRAVEMELGEQGLGAELIAKNLDLAQKVFELLEPVQLKPVAEPPIESKPLTVVEQKSVADAAPIIFAPGNMALRKTGNWRVDRPVIDYENCNKCLICYARCPDGTIFLRPDGNPEIDYDHCKGCMICALECPGHFIKTVREAGSWT